MISFSNPVWLYGLLGLLIPIGIHLLSRKEGKTIYIGSVRHLVDSDTAQFSSIRLNEIVLLILRLLLLTILVFILAGFQIDLKSDENKKWLVVEKGIEQDSNYKNLIDSLQSKGFEIHWLAENLPLQGDSNQTEQSSYYRLLSQIQRKADTAVVLSYNLVSRFKGEKTPLPSMVKWLDVEPDAKQFAVQAIKHSGDSTITRISNSSPEGTSFDYSRLTNNEFERITKIDSLQVNEPDTIHIAIFADPSFSYDKKIIQASMQAIAHELPHKLKVTIVKQTAEIADKTDLIFWLSDQPCTIKNTVVLGYQNCANANLPILVAREKFELYCSSSESFDWIITKRLNEENVLAESFSFSLAKILLDNRFESLTKNSSIVDQRSLSTEAAFADAGDVNDSKTAVHESLAQSEPPLLILLFLVLIIERYVAFKRYQ